MVFTNMSEDSFLMINAIGLSYKGEDRELRQCRRTAFGTLY